MLHGTISHLDIAASFSVRSIGERLDILGSDVSCGLPLRLVPHRRQDDCLHTVALCRNGRGESIVLRVPLLQGRYIWGGRYLGAQLRAAIERDCRSPIALIGQVDDGIRSGYNVDHHLNTFNGQRFTMCSTTGDALHVALIADVPFNCHCSVGLQNGQLGTDETWDNAVRVNSSQNSLTAYLRYLW
jgi:hypothetical protein